MVIDFRIRPPFKSIARMRHFKPQTILPRQDLLQEPLIGYDRKYMPSADRKDMDCFMHEMDEANIRVGVIMGRVNDHDPTSKHDNKDLLELTELYPGRFIPLASFDPTGKNAVAEAEKALNEGFAGLSFDLGFVSMHPDDAMMLPFYELCHQKECLVALAASAFIGPDLSYCDLTPLGPVAKKFPRAVFYIPHAGWPHIAQAIGVAASCPNVYLAPDLYMTIPHIPYARDLVDAANSVLMSKIVFASSYPMRGLKQSVDEWAAVPLSEHARRYTMYYNGARLLKL